MLVYKIRPVVGIILVVLSFLILSDTIVNVLANVTTAFREDNRASLYETAYKDKADDLERQILEYDRARESLSIYEGSSYVLAKIAIRNIYDIYDYLIVATDSKVNVGDLAINEDGLVGIVSEATKTTAKVDLITSHEGLSVKVGGNYGLLSQYDKEHDEFVIRNIDNYKDVQLGDAVTTSGIQEGIASGYKIGVVTSAENKGVEKVVKVKPYVSFDDLNYLIIVAK